MAAKSLAEIATLIKVLEKKTVANIVEIGKLLQEASKKCVHGEYREWLKTNFGWSHDTARNYRNVYELDEKTKFSSFTKFDISISALYLVARNLRDDANEDDQAAGLAVIEAAKVGRVSYQMAVDILDAADAEDLAPAEPEEVSPVDVNVVRLQQPDVVIEPDADTPEQRWQRSLTNAADDAIALRAFWTREFPDWEKFGVPTNLAALALQAADAWGKLAVELRDRSKPAADRAEAKSKTVHH